MTMKRFIVAGASVLLILLTAPFIYLLTINPNDYREEIKEVVTTATGRQLELGPIHLEVALRPKLVIRQLLLSNADWAQQPALLTVGELHARVSIMALVFGRLEITDLVLSDAVLELERAANGSSNWTFQEGTTEPAGSASSNRLLPELHNGTFLHSRIRYIDAVNTAQHTLSIERLDLGRSPDGERLTLKLTGEANGHPLSAEGQSGHLLDLLAGTQPWPVDMKARFLEVSVRLSGAFDEEQGQPAWNLLIEAEGDSLQALAEAAALELPGGLAFNLETQLIAAPTTLSLAQMSLKLGASDTTGTVKLEHGNGRSRVDAVLQFGRLDPIELAGAVSVTAKATAETKVAAQDDGIGLKALLAVQDAQVSIGVDTLVLKNLEVSNVETQITLEAGRLQVGPLNAEVASSRLDSLLTLDATKRKPSLVLSLKAPGLAMGQLLVSEDGNSYLLGNADLAVDVTGKGNSPTAIASSLVGNARLLMGKGQIKAAGVEKMVGGITTLVDTMSSGENEWTELTCLAADFEIKKGVARRRVLLADTPHSTVLGEGKIDLRNGQLDLTFTPSPKSSTLNVALPVTIRGDIMEPEFGVDELGAARRLGGLLGSVLFPPAALLAFADIGTGEDNPCLKLKAGKGAGGSAPSAQAPKGTTAAKAKGDGGESTTDKAKKAVESVVEEIGSGLKSLFGN